MSVLPQELLRKISTDSNNLRKEASSARSAERFKELMKVEAIEDEPHKRDFFSLLEEEEEKEPQATEAPFTPALSLLLNIEAPKGVSYPSFDPQIDALFEKMASSMIMLCSSGETETTLYLDQPQFASSVFFGTTITVREFSTAPKAFNIEIGSTPAAMAHLQAGMTALLEAFQNGKFNFSVHRIDTHVQTKDRPVLHRKENEDHGKEENQGDRK